MSSADHLYVERNDASEALDRELVLLESLIVKRDKLLVQIEECKKRRNEALDRYERACKDIDDHESETMHKPHMRHLRFATKENDKF